MITFKCFKYSQYWHLQCPFADDDAFVALNKPARSLRLILLPGGYTESRLNINFYLFSRIREI